MKAGGGALPSFFSRCFIDFVHSNRHVRHDRQAFVSYFDKPLSYGHEVVAPAFVHNQFTRHQYASSTGRADAEPPFGLPPQAE